MKKTFFILFVFFSFLFILPFFHAFSLAKYSFDSIFIASKIIIDRKPSIEVLSISNNNINYEKYANNSHEISLKIKVTEKNIVVNNLYNNYIKFYTEDTLILPYSSVTLLSQTNDTYIYNLKISNITGNGKLYIIFPYGTIQDNLSQSNDYQKFNTNITIDNIPPSLNSEEKSLVDNNSNYIIHSSEPIRPFDTWTLSANNLTLSKIFNSPIYYPITLTDYAGNSTQTFINVTQARNIMLYYSNFNNYPISNFETNGQISGKQAILDKSILKCEALFTRLEGNISINSLQMRAFDYTYWGKNKSSICNYSELEYKHGYNPSSYSWLDYNSNNNSYFLRKICMQIGGKGQNYAGNTCKQEYNPIPTDIANQYLYGLSGISFNLKNQPKLSIIYQIYVPNVGWLKTSSDGEETTYSHDKPFSAIRINIIPKSEKNYILNYWNSFIGTHRVD